MNKRSTRRNEDQAHIAVRHGDDDRRDSGGGRIQHGRFYPDDDVLAELNELKEVAVLDPVLVECAFRAGKCLAMAVHCILDEFDESKLPFTRTAIFAALVNAAEENKPVRDLARIGDFATLCDILHRRRLRRRAC
jgi:hypothetical protein